MSKHILILGGGYGGLLSALSAREHFGVAAKITLINRFPTHQIITELHRLAKRQHRRESSSFAARQASARRER